MKANNKNRKQPTCSRCRFHGKRDIRVLQHQCPFKSCTCSSCFLIKRRSIIYRAQKNLDKQDDNSNEQPSSPSSASTASSGGCTGGSPHLLAGGSNCQGTVAGEYQSRGKMTGAAPPAFDHPLSWSNGVAPLSGHSQYNHYPPHGGGGPYYSQRNMDTRRIGDFQTLCLTFPDYSPSQLQSLFEQSGSDFQRTIDQILMSKWYSESGVKSEMPSQNYEGGTHQFGYGDHGHNSSYGAHPYSGSDYASHHEPCEDLSSSSYQYAYPSPAPSAAEDRRIGRGPSSFDAPVSHTPQYYGDAEESAVCNNYRQVVSSEAYRSISCAPDAAQREMQATSDGYPSPDTWSLMSNTFGNNHDAEHVQSVDSHVLEEGDEEEGDWSTCYPSFSESNDELVIGVDYNETAKSGNEADLDSNHGLDRSSAQIETDS